MRPIFNQNQTMHCRRNINVNNKYIVIKPLLQLEILETN